MTEKKLPPGWEPGTDCIAYKHLDDFRYAEVRYVPGGGLWHGLDYVLYTVNRDGPRQEERQSIHADIGKAMKAGDGL